MDRELSQTDWQVGQRVRRLKVEAAGIITEVNGQIKVKWDDGRTSYYPNHSTEIKIQSE